MICQFCNNETTYHPIDILNRYTLKVYFCYPCQAEYVSMFGNRIHIYATLNDRLYRWTNNDNCLGQLWIINSPGIPGSELNEDVELLKTFKENMPEINPSNAKEKIKLLLLFL